MIFDFHTHTFISDGVNNPVELIRFAYAGGYKAIAITDHVSYGNIERATEGAIKDCRLAETYWDIKAIPGVELSNIPAGSIDDMAKYAKEIGAKLVVVHGESIVEKVEEGTNLNAVSSGYVDILAHPGLITEEVVKIAVKNGVYLEITKRQGHCLSNGLVAKLSLQFGAKLIINSDAHSHKDLYVPGFQKIVAKSAGLPEDVACKIISENSRELLKKIGCSI